MAQKTVPLVMVHDDRRINIGTATVDTALMETKGHIEFEGRELYEIVGTSFTLGPARGGVTGA